MYVADDVPEGVNRRHHSIEIALRLDLGGSMDLRSRVMVLVRRGEKLLDEKGPSNWRDLVRDGGIHTLTRHEMLRVDGEIGKCGCVLGRTYGSFMAGIHTLGFQSSLATREFRPSQYGFAFPGELSGSSDLVFSLLADCWREVIGD